METRIYPQHLLPLASLRRGQRMVVRSIMRGCGAHGRLTALGLRRGALVEVVRPSRLHGPLIVRVDDFQVAIGCCLAEAILGELS